MRSVYRETPFAMNENRRDRTQGAVWPNGARRSVDERLSQSVSFNANHFRESFQRFRHMTDILPGSNIVPQVGIGHPGRRRDVVRPAFEFMTDVGMKDDESLVCG